jgi:hypothetical protein
MFRQALRILAGVVPALLVSELVIRQFWVHQRVTEPDYVKIPTPNTESVWCLEGCGHTHRLSHGERAGYPADAPKVIVLGDSFTEALEVDDDQTYFHVAQEKLAAQGIKLGLVGLGLAGRSVADYVGFAERHKKLFHPVWTVVTIRDDDVAEDTVRPAKTSFRRGPDGKLAVSFDEERSAPGLRDALWNAPSIFVRYTAYRAHKFAEAAEAEPPMFFAASHEGAAAPKPEAGFAPGREPQVGDYGVYPVEEELGMLRQAYDGRLTIVFIPYIDFQAGGEPRINDSPIRQRVLKYCAATGLSCVEPVVPFLAMARQYKSPFGFTNTKFNYGHMNAGGHALVGEELAKELARLKTNAVF